MCVQANLQGTDERLVYLVRTSECRCSDGIVVDEIGVALPIANLDLNKLTELTDLIPEGTEARCLCCGRVNPVDYRAGFVIPADSAELALAWVVPTGGSGQLMLVQPAETDDPTVVSRLAAALYEPRLCNPVEFDEFAVLESWGRPPTPSTPSSGRRRAPLGGRASTRTGGRPTTGPGAADTRRTYRLEIEPRTRDHTRRQVRAPRGGAIAWRHPPRRTRSRTLWSLEHGRRRRVRVTSCRLRADVNALRRVPSLSPRRCARGS
jgi:hypothetical protein